MSNTEGDFKLLVPT